MYHSCIPLSYGIISDHSDSYIKGGISALSTYQSRCVAFSLCLNTTGHSYCHLCNSYYIRKADHPLSADVGLTIIYISISNTIRHWCTYQRIILCLNSPGHSYLYLRNSCYIRKAEHPLSADIGQIINYISISNTIRHWCTYQSRILLCLNTPGHSYLHLSNSYYICNADHLLSARLLII